MLEALVVNEVLENVFHSIDCHVINFRHVKKQEIHHPIVVGF
jgi:hypothetical protein